jgi:hypothetical protein
MTELLKYLNKQMKHHKKALSNAVMHGQWQSASDNEIVVEALKRIIFEAKQCGKDVK